MYLEYRPDIEETLERYRMWWNRENFGRCAIDIIVTKPPSPDNPPVKAPAEVKNRWIDFEYLKALYEYNLKRQVFHYILQQRHVHNLFRRRYRTV